MTVAERLGKPIKQGYQIASYALFIGGKIIPKDSDTVFKKKKAWEKAEELSCIKIPVAKPEDLSPVPEP